MTPYGVAKAYAHFSARSYRHRYGLFACSGILYNHESPRRPLEFLPRKVAHGAAAVSLGLQDELVLGDLDARRDWGYAGDYVRAMWLMLQQDEPGDYIVASGEGHAVQELVECAFGHVGLVRPGAARYENLAGIEGRIELYEADLLNPTSLAQALRAARPAEVDCARVSTKPRLAWSGDERAPAAADRRFRDPRRQ